MLKYVPLYVDDRAAVLNVEEGSEGEGNFQQFKMEYPWQQEHPYRMLIQIGELPVSVLHCHIRIRIQLEYPADIALLITVSVEIVNRKLHVFGQGKTYVIPRHVLHGIKTHI